MSNPLVDRIPHRFLPLAALAAGRPDAAALHLNAANVSTVGDVANLSSEVEMLRGEVAQLREELSVALEFVDRIVAERPSASA